MRQDWPSCGRLPSTSAGVHEHSCLTWRYCVVSGPAKKRAVPVGAGRPTGSNGAPSTQVAARAPSPKVIHTHFNATTMRDDSRLIIISLIVAGVKRPIRALLDSGASNNFFRASCLSLLPSTIPVREGPGDIVAKLADGQPQRVPRKTVVLPYTLDGFQSNDEFLVYEMNYAFDCIL